MKVALGITGCIAAYKAIEVMRALQRKGIEVQAILTKSARNFVGPLTFESLSAQPVICGMFRAGGNMRIEHIRLAQEIQLLAVVPATANILGKFANGIADDFLSTLYLSCPAPVLIAPAMNVEMWNHPAVRANVARLKERGHRFIDPASGILACGMEGQGKLADTEIIIDEILAMLGSSDKLSGLKILVTAGPTIEDIDPVRFISNRSSGKMGYAIAQRARIEGATVTLISGPTQLQAPAGVRFVGVRSAAEMKDAVLREFPLMDIVIKAAAVSDYRPVEIAAEKVKKGPRMIGLSLQPTEDILEFLGRTKMNQVLVGFAAETENLLENARLKLERKNLDLIIANDVSQGVFGADRATVSMLGPGDTIETIRNASKSEIARRILGLAATLHASRVQQTASREAHSPR